MCGIIGYVGNHRAADVLLKGLKRLEYRGYDSSGVALFGEDKKIDIHKSEGKIGQMESLLDQSLTARNSRGGIGHTRWATHGAPNSVNAHPHRVKDVVLVHNGIIENYREIRDMVEERGYTPSSDTDSEMFAFLVHFEMESGYEFVESVRRSFGKISGSSSFVAMCERHPGMIVGIRNGSPLVVAKGGNLQGIMLASDAQPVLDYADEICFLENGDLVVCEDGRVDFIDAANGNSIDRKITKVDWSADSLNKNGYAHYMLKEINEQGLTIKNTLDSLCKPGTLPFEFIDNRGIDTLLKASRLSLVACGTSWHASLLGKYWIERMAGVSVESDLASEFRYRDPVLEKNQAVIGISQSGETADTLAALKNVKQKEISTLAITNVKGSTISREVGQVFFTSAGPEIGVASTKAFTGQLLVLFLLAGRLAREKIGSKDSIKKLEELNGLFRQLYEIPHYLNEALREDSLTSQAVNEAVEATRNSKGFFFIGRGYSHPIVLEGALKLKEIAYVHAEGYAAGELKHGPIAMLEPDFAVIVLAPMDAWYDKTVSNLQEVKARGAKIIAIGHADDARLPSMCDIFIPMPVAAERRADCSAVLNECLNPFLLGPILQLFSYRMALAKGTNVDQPRNLAKSVTVE